MALILATLSSLIFGVADFAGALAARRVPAVTVVVGAHLTGLVGLSAVASLFAPGPPPAADLGWGVLAGLGGSVGIALLYHALATTPMSVTAPVAAVVGTAVPVVFGVIIGERPDPVAWVGMVLVIPALLLIPARGEAGSGSSMRALGLGSAVGVFFGLFGILISRTGDASGIWPLVAARATSVALMIGVALAWHRPVVPRRHAWPLACTAGLLDSAANVLFVLAVRMELLSLVAVIMAMYPASTVGLARIVLDERVHRTQVVGMGIAVVALILIAVA